MSLREIDDEIENYLRFRGFHDILLQFQHLREAQFDSSDPIEIADHITQLALAGQVDKVSFEFQRFANKAMLGVSLKIALANLRLRDLTEYRGRLDVLKQKQEAQFADFDGQYIGYLQDAFVREYRRQLEVFLNQHSFSVQKPRLLDREAIFATLKQKIEKLREYIAVLEDNAGK